MEDTIRVADTVGGRGGGSFAREQCQGRHFPLADSILGTDPGGQFLRGHYSLWHRNARERRNRKPGTLERRNKKKLERYNIDKENQERE